MRKKIPNILANHKYVVSNFLDRNPGLFIGDTEEVLDIKNQYLIETYKDLDVHMLIKKLNLAYGTVSADTGDGYDDFHFYPFVEIKRKGSGINDILKKNNHLPCGFFCIHDWANIDRRTFDFHSSYHQYTKKKYLVKSIQVTSGSIAILPVSNNLKNSPFRGLSYWDRYDLNLFSLGKNKKIVIEKLKKKARTSSFKFKLDGLNKINEDQKQKKNIIKSACFSSPWEYHTYFEFVKDLEKSGAKVELINPSYKPYEDYDKDKLKIFQKELNSIKKQKNKKKGWGDLIKCQVENGIYNVYDTEIISEEDTSEDIEYPHYSKAVLVVKK